MVDVDIAVVGCPIGVATSAQVDQTLIGGKPKLCSSGGWLVEHRGDGYRTLSFGWMVAMSLE